MTAPELLEQLEAIAAGHHEIGIPAELWALQPFSPLSSELAAVMTAPTLVALADIVGAGAAPTAFGPVVAQLHEAANRARTAGRHQEAIEYFERVLRLCPDDINVRVAIAQHAEQIGDWPWLVRILEPSSPYLLQHLPQFRDLLRSFGKAASHVGQAGQRIHGQQVLERVIRSEAAERAGVLLQQRSTASPHPGAAWQAVIQALCSPTEFEMLDHLRRAEATLGDDQAAHPLATQLAATAASAATRQWTRPFALASRLFGQVLRSAEDRHAIATAWTDAGLDPLALQAHAVPADEAARAEAGRAHAAFQARPDIGALLRSWTAAFEAHELTPLIRLAATGSAADRATAAETDPLFDRLAAIRAALQPGRPADAAMAPIWFFITWQKGAAQLFRQITALYAPTNTVIISIGGLETPAELSALTPLLLLDNTHCLFRPAVTWGGPKLFFHNTFEVMQAFLASRRPAAWFQVLCHRSYPLLPAREIGTLLADPNFLAIFPFLRASPDHIADVEGKLTHALDLLFETGSTEGLDPLDPGATGLRLNACRYNFSDVPLHAGTDQHSIGHHYMISPFAADMRWMTYGRLTEFVDVASETGATYSRRMTPLMTRWITSVLDRHKLVIGDPFLLMSRRFVDVAINDDRARELAAAMQPGFAPEMNFFDTVLETPSYDVADQAGHVYHLRSGDFAVPDDIAPSSFSADVLRRLFIRKTAGPVSTEFLANYAERCGEDWPKDEFFLGAAMQAPSVMLDASIPALDAHLFDRLIGRSCRIENLNGVLKSIVFFKSNHDITAPDGVIVGRWTLDGAQLETTFEWGSKIYRRMLSDGDSLILPPSEVVGPLSDWGLFLKFKLADICTAHDAVSIVPPIHLHDVLAPGTWCGSHARHATLLNACESAPVDDYPVPVEQFLVDVHEVRAAGTRTLLLATVQGFPTMLRLDGVYLAARKAVAITTRASADDLLTWETAARAIPPLHMTRQDLRGPATIDFMQGKRGLSIELDGRVIDHDGAIQGYWLALEARIWFFGIPGMRIALATQFAHTGGQWQVSGWAWKNLIDPVTFRITVGAPPDAPHPGVVNPAPH